MRVRSIKEINKEFADVFNNSEVYALSQWYARGPEPLGNPEPFDEKKHLQRASENTKGIGKIIDAIDGI